MRKPRIVNGPESVGDCLSHLVGLARIFRGRAEPRAAISWAQIEVMLADLAARQTEPTAAAATQPADNAASL